MTIGLFTARGPSSEEVNLPENATLTVQVTGTFVGTIVLTRRLTSNAEEAWALVHTFTGVDEYVTEEPGRYRLTVSDFTSGVIYYSLDVDQHPITSGGGGGGDGGVGIVAGANSVTTGNVRFSNSNGVSFGLNGSTLTASIAAVIASASLYAASNTTQGTSGTAPFSGFTFAGAGIASVGVTNGSVVVSVPAGGGVADGGIFASAAGGSLSSGNLIFSNANGLSFGINGSTLTASHNGITTAAASNHSHGNPTLALTNLSGTTASNSAGLTLSLSAANPGAGGGAAISAAGSSQSAGTVVFSNANGVSFGMNGSTVTGSHNGLTSQSNQAVSAANGNFTFQTLSLSNANGVSFGTSAGSAITASVAAQTNQTIGVYGSSQTTAQSSSSTFDARSLSIRGAGVLSVGMSAGEIIISATAAGGGGADGGVFVSAAGSSQTAGNIIFSNANGVSFGMNGSTVTGSHNGLTTARASNDAIGLNTALTANGVSVTANSSGLSLNFPAFLTTQSGQGLSAQGGSSAFQTLVFTNSNGISFSNTNGSIWASHNALTTARASNDGIGLNTAGTNVTWTANSSGLSINAAGYAGTGTSATNASVTLNSNGLAISVAAPGGAASNTVSFTGNTTQGSTGTAALSSGIMRGAGIVSVGFSGGSTIISAPDAVDFTQMSVGFSTNGNTAGNTGLVTGRMVLVGTNGITLSGSTNAGSMTISFSGGGGGGGPAISASGSSQSAGTLVFSNSNGISFGMNGSTITATVTPGAAAGIAAFANSNTTYTSGTVNFVEGGGALTIASSAGQQFRLSVPATSSLSATGALSISTNGSTISIGVANPSTETGGYFPSADLELVTQQHGNGTIVFDPETFPNIAFDRVMLPVFHTNTSNSSGSHTVSFLFGLYSRNASSLSLISSVSSSTNFSASGTVGSYSLYSGIRMFTMPLTMTVNAGKYWMALASITTSGGAAGQTVAVVAASNIASMFLGHLGSSHNTTQQFTLGQGVYSATSSGMPVSVAFSQIRGSDSGAQRPPALMFASGTV